MVNRFSHKASRSRLILICVFLILVPGLYLMYRNSQENYKASKFVEKRCLSELSSVKYQLDVVTGYKTHLEALLAEAKQATKMENDKLKEMEDSCLTMKQQSSLCQSQFDDMQIECKKVKETYNREKSETNQLKDQLEEANKLREASQKITAEISEEVSRLRQQNRALLGQIRENISRATSVKNGLSSVLKKGDANFSEVVDDNNGTYEIVPKVAAKINQENANNANNANALPLREKVPPGFAPVLPVVDVERSANVPKPPRVSPELPAKRHQPDGDLVIVDRDERVQEERRPVRQERNDPNQGGEQIANEDDDDGEEYAA